MPRASQSRECVSHLLTFTVCGVCPIGHARRGSTESASHRRLRVCSAAALRGALLAHAAWCATRTRLWLVSCYSPIAREQLVTMKRSPCVLCSSLFGRGRSHFPLRQKYKVVVFELEEEEEVKLNFNKFNGESDHACGLDLGACSITLRRSCTRNPK